MLVFMTTFATNDIIWFVALFLMLYECSVIVAICSEDEARAGGALHTMVAPEEVAVFKLETGTARNRKRVKYTTVSSGTCPEQPPLKMMQIREARRKTAGDGRPRMVFCRSEM